MRPVAKVNDSASNQRSRDRVNGASATGASEPRLSARQQHRESGHAAERLSPAPPASAMEQRDRSGEQSADDGKPSDAVRSRG
jgi:hypothetical protein